MKRKEKIRKAEAKVGVPMPGMGGAVSTTCSASRPGGTPVDAKI